MIRRMQNWGHGKRAWFEILESGGKAISRYALSAEDLGLISEEVRIRDSAGLPGMAVLQLFFDGNTENLYLPHNLKDLGLVPALMTTIPLLAGMSLH